MSITGSENSMKLVTLLLIMFISLFQSLHSTVRGSSTPYITGDGFREFCDHIYDETDVSLKPENVLDRQKIFVKTDYLKDFFHQIHPNLQVSYILVSHNSDDHVTQNFAQFLKSEKLIAWFAQNVEGLTHPKLHPIPIGIANRMWEHGNPKLIREVASIKDSVNKNIMLYLNFDEKTFLKERRDVANLFKNKPFCVVSSPKPFKDYLFDLCQSKFVLSPRGNGLDCHRTWESLLMGTIPIVKSSSLDPLFDDLPVLLVNDWNEITLDYLEEKYLEMRSKEYSMEKAYLQYWLDLIESVTDSYQLSRNLK